MASASSTTSRPPRESQPVTPVISVVMPTWNGERFLRPAIESILNQTFGDFELILIDDGSTDSTPRILADYKDKDKDGRLVVLTNERNVGIAAATNRGLAAARGEYIALQDHDDISLPHRFQTQVDFLRANQDIAVVGSAATLIDEDGANQGDFYQPCEELELKWELLWSCPVHCTTVMMKRTAIIEVGAYDEDPALRFAEAWDPLARIAMRYRIVNLPDRLALWRRHSTATSVRYRQGAQAACDATVRKNLFRLSNSSESDAASDHEFRYLGMRAFLFTPAGNLPDLPARQVIAGLELLLEVQKSFYRINNFPRSLLARHRKALNWSWGKHAIALGIRAPWLWNAKLRILLLGARSAAMWIQAALFLG
jgi:glycosyltransferase involved in cell wall biosynthesis